jgi:hypothetical protein
MRGGAGNRRGGNLKGATRKRLPGDRYDCGKLKPQPVAGNDRVLAERRALLGLGEEASTLALAAGENALDVALARGWLSEARRAAADTYANLCAIHAPQIVERLGYAQSRSDSAMPSAEVLTPGDYAYREALKRHERGLITDAALARAERQHLRERVDWSRMRSADVYRLFKVAVIEGRGLPPGMDDTAIIKRMRGDGDDPAETAAGSRLQRIRRALSDDHLRELFDVCVIDSWPMWIRCRITGEPVRPAWDRHRVLLDEGLDAVIASQPPRLKSEIMIEATTINPAAEPLPEPVRRYPKRAEVTEYVDHQGNPVRTVVRLQRRARDERESTRGN